jgi:hypothetical protein
MATPEAVPTEQDENPNVCTHCSSTRFVVVQTYRSWYMCECSRCQQVFCLPRRAKKGGEA